MANAAKMRALDIVGSATERHRGGTLNPSMIPTEDGRRHFAQTSYWARPLAPPR